MIAGYAVPDFSSEFWHYFIAGITVVSIIGVIWFLMSHTTRKLAPGEKAEVLEHAWDGDLQELNNPLPRWWLYLFWFLIVFSIVYLILYPGLGAFSGVLNWSSAGQYKAEKARVDAEFDKVIQPFMSMNLMAVAANPKAKEMGQHLYLTYCSQCHGSGGLGDGKDFPNLTDKLWLFGGDPASIRATISNGTMLNMMPALGDAVGGEQGAKEVASYVLSLAGKPHDATLAEAGKAKFAVCAGCHGEGGKGNPAIHAPDLSATTGGEADIVEAIIKGRKGGMPAFQTSLGNAKIHLLAAYVWGLGGGVKPPMAAAAQ